MEGPGCPLPVLVGVYAIMNYAYRQRDSEIQSLTSERDRYEKALERISERSCMCSSLDDDGEGNFPKCHSCIAKQALEVTK